MKRPVFWLCVLPLLFLAAQSVTGLGAPEPVEQATPSSGHATQLITMLITFALIRVPLGLIPAFIARNKGRKFGPWFVYGIFLFLVALIHSVAIKLPSIKCPYCAEQIRPEAKVCRFCGRDLAGTAS